MDNVLGEYPRPQLRRDSYINLNGNWKCRIDDSNGEFKYKGSILVPYSPETTKSGVHVTVMPGDTINYYTELKLPKNFVKDRVLLNFGAVDQICTLYVNERRVGTHYGGYIPFSFDITDYLNDENKIRIEVKDYTEKSGLSRGKQSLKPSGIMYQAQSGIWQTIWLESVPKYYIKNVKITPNVDNQSVSIKVISNKDESCLVIIDDKLYKITTNKTHEIKLDNPKYWSIDNPYLYEVKIKTYSDEVRTYFGYRKIEVKKENDIPYLYLNNEKIFIKGILEQGYYKDGLYTVDDYNTILDDIRTIKECGFNTIRKHIKIEPALYYYYCDLNGMLVIQDMVNGGGKYNKAVVGLPIFVDGLNLSDSNYMLFSRNNENAKKVFEYEVKKTVESLYSFPSIIMWTIFNEGWGQYDSKELYDLVSRLDKSRIIDPSSGWYDQGIGVLKSDHNYYKPYNYKMDELERATLLSEFGGYSLGDSKFTYKSCASEKEYLYALKRLIERDVKPYIDNGLVGYVYTQYNDIQDEQNGIVNEDRKLKTKKISNIFKEL